MKLKLQALAVIMLLALGGYVAASIGQDDDSEVVRMAIIFPHLKRTERNPVTIYYTVNGQEKKVGRKYIQWKDEIRVPRGSAVLLYGQQNVERRLECALQVGTRPLVRDWRTTMGGVWCMSQGGG